MHWNGSPMPCSARLVCHICRLCCLCGCAGQHAPVYSTVLEAAVRPRRLLGQGSTLWDLLRQAPGPLPPALLRVIARDLLLVHLGLLLSASHIQAISGWKRGCYYGSLMQ